MPNLTVDSQPEPSDLSNPIPVNPSSHNFSKSVLIGISIFILLSLTAYGAYWYGQSVMMTKSISSTSFSTEKVSSFSNVPTTKPAPATSNETANWKTFANHKYNFSFKYPNDFIVSDSTSKFDDNFRVTVTNGQTEDAVGNYRGIEKDKMEITVSVEGKDFKKPGYYYGGYEWTRSVLGLLSKAKNGTRMSHNDGDTTDNVNNEVVTKIGDVNIDGFVGVKYRAVPTVEGSSSTDVALMVGGRTFLVSGLTGDDPLVFTKPYSDTFDNILSTFKFL